LIPRYTRPEVPALGTPEARYNRWLEVELNAFEAMVEEGLAPPQALAACSAMPAIQPADAERIEEIGRPPGTTSSPSSHSSGSASAPRRATRISG
jgi:adenylosuccinate lyase